MSKEKIEKDAIYYIAYLSIFPIEETIKIVGAVYCVCQVNYFIQRHLNHRPTYYVLLIRTNSWK